MADMEQDKWTEEPLAVDDENVASGTEKGGGTGSFVKMILKSEDPKIYSFLRRQWLFLSLCFVFVMIYIGNRYSCQQKQLEIESLKKELRDIRYQALNVTSDVSARSKASYIESVVSSNGSGLVTTVEPAYTFEK